MGHDNHDREGPEEEKVTEEKTYYPKIHDAGVEIEFEAPQTIIIAKEKNVRFTYSYIIVFSYANERRNRTNSYRFISPISMDYMQSQVMLSLSYH